MPKQRAVDPTREEAATALVSFRVSRRPTARPTHQGTDTVKRTMRWMYLNEHTKKDDEGKPVTYTTYDPTPSSDSSKRIRVAYYEPKGQR